MMRQFLLFCLLASAGAPTFALENKEEERRYQPSRPDRQDPVARPQRSTQRALGRVETRGASVNADERPVRSPLAGNRHRSEPEHRIGDLPGNRRDRARGRAWVEEERRTRNQAEAQQEEVRQQRWARDRQRSRPYDGEWDERMRRRAGGSITPRDQGQPSLGVAHDDRNSPRHHWRSDWRTDTRYDWRRHRERNRWIFSLGTYYDPFGWDYRRFNVGRRLAPGYFSARYWLDDPWRFRLPPAYPGTRWIRYHGDAVLVDTWTGEVIDVIHDVFW